MTVTRDEVQAAAAQAFGDTPSTDPAASWSVIADMGWLMMTVPEARGGLGLDRVAEGVIHTALGRALVPGPAIAQMLAITALNAADGLSEGDDLLGRAMTGEVMTASLSTGDTLDCVPDADRASHLLTVASERVALVPLDRATIVRRETWDRTRRLFDVTPVTPGLTLAEGEAAAALGARISAQQSFALAGDCIGGAAAILERTIAYLGMRRQFDRPLALFQALKHRVADLKTALAAAEALYWSRAADPTADAGAMGALKAHAATVYRAVAEEAIQLHGGIGLTSEHDCHLFLKRATLNAALGGDADLWDEMTGRRALDAAG